MAAVVHVGGGGRVRVVRGREPEEGRSCGRERERGQEGARRRLEPSRASAEAGGGRGAWARTAATRLSSYWQEVGDDWQRRWAGPARWAAPGRWLGESLLFPFAFSFLILTFVS